MVVAPLPPLALTTVNTFPRGPSRSTFRCAAVQPYECFEKVSGGGGALDVLAGAGTHRPNNHLGLRHATDGKDDRAGELLVDQFNGAERQGVVLGGHIYQYDGRIRALDTAQNRVADRIGKSGAGVDNSRHAGTVHQYLQHARCSLS